MSSKDSSDSIGFIGLLTIAFIVLKLTGYITWSWWLVLMPLYVIPLIIVFFGVLYLLMDFIRESK